MGEHPDHYVSRMDVEWFKQQQRRAGRTTADLAHAIGRDRTVISHIYAGKRKFTFEDAQAFAAVLAVPLPDVLLRAGLSDANTATTQRPGFSESDAAPWLPASHDAQASIAQALGGGVNGIDIWRIKSHAMAMAGLLVGDFVLIDTLKRDACRAGDIVIAQVYDHQVGTAVTLLRRYDPPALTAASTDPADWRAYIVDDNNVLIMGKVVASWRDYKATS